MRQEPFSLSLVKLILITTIIISIGIALLIGTTGYFLSKPKIEPIISGPASTPTEEIIKDEPSNLEVDKIKNGDEKECPKVGDLSILSNHSYTYNKARITTKKGDRGGSVGFPNKVYVIDEDNFLLEGVNTPDATKITVKWEDDGKEQEISDFQKGDTHWCYEISEKIGNVRRGSNIYYVKIYFGEEVIEYSVQLFFKKPLPLDVITKEVTISIDWFPEIKKVPTEEFFSKEILGDFPVDCYSEDPCYNIFAFYQAGIVKSEEYKNYGFYLISRANEGHGISYYFYRILFNPSDKRMIFLKKYSNEPEYEDISFFVEAENITVENLIPKKEIPIPNSSYFLEAHSESPNIFFSKVIKRENSKKLFTDANVGDIFIDEKTKTFFIRMPDGSVKIYRIKLPFVKSQDKSEKNWNHDDLLLDIEFLDDKKNAEYYSHGSRYQFVCAGGSLYDIFPEKDLKPETQLKLVGLSPTGEKFYEFKDSNDKFLKDFYDGISLPSGLPYYVDRKIYTYEKFVSLHPLLFWKDPFGRWIQFTNNKFSPAIECGGGEMISAI